MKMNIVSNNGKNVVQLAATGAANPYINQQLSEQQQQAVSLAD